MKLLESGSMEGPSILSLTGVTGGSSGGGGGGSSIDFETKKRLCPYESNLLTIEKFPMGGIKHIGGMVTARSVKLLDQSDREIRDAWWTELREEIRSHARVIGCQHIVGYSEKTTLYDDLCILSASGTAVVLNLYAFQSPISTTTMGFWNEGLSLMTKQQPSQQSQPSQQQSQPSQQQSQPSQQSQQSQLQPSETKEITIKAMSKSSDIIEDPTAKLENALGTTTLSLDSFMTDTPSEETKFHRDSAIEVNRRYHRHQQHRRQFQRRNTKPFSYRPSPPCSLCHIPYNRRRSPFPMRFLKCALCEKRYIPEMIMASIEPPAELWILSHETLIEARVCREKEDKEGESHATMISEMIPFIEYELHRQMVYKVKLNGLNSIFGVQCQIIIGESLVIGVAIGTGYFIPSLPTPAPLQIEGSMNIASPDKDLEHLRDTLISFNEHKRKLIEETKLNMLCNNESRDHIMKGYRRKIRNPWFYQDAMKQRCSDSTSGSLQLSSTHKIHRNVMTTASGSHDPHSSLSDLDHSSSSSSSLSSLSSSLSSSSSSSSSSSFSSLESHLDEMNITSPNSFDEKEKIHHDRRKSSAFVVEIDDKFDQDVLRLLVEPKLPDGVHLTSIHQPLIMNHPTKRLDHVRMLSLMSRKTLEESNNIEH
jgi:hypothetical protein